jgi:hypothetical protein
MREIIWEKVFIIKRCKKKKKLKISFQEISFLNKSGDNGTGSSHDTNSGDILVTSRGADGGGRR